MIPEAVVPAVNPPNFTDYQTFIINVMGITATYLSPTDPAIAGSLYTAISTVNLQIQCISPWLYNQAVYNLAGAFLITYASDIPHVFATNPDGSQQLDANNQPIGYFQNIRTKMDLTGQAPGFLQSTADEGTSASFQVPKAMESLSFGDLQLLKSPWGRRYLSIAQQYGAIGGIS